MYVIKTYWKYYRRIDHYIHTLHREYIHYPKHVNQTSVYYVHIVSFFFNIRENIYTLVVPILAKRIFYSEKNNRK